MKIHKIQCLLICFIVTLFPLTSIGAVQNDADLITYSIIAPHENGSNQIKRSLNLIDTVGGSTVSWSSSDTSRITNSGRVIRPRWYEQNVTVTMTATVTNGTSVTKNFNFTLLKDEAWSDPQYMTDAAFFGVWNGSKWTTQGKLNYDFPGLVSVGEAVKAGNLILAKARLQEYYANRTPKTNILTTSQMPLYAAALVDDFHTLQSPAYFQGEFNVSNQWGTYEANLRIDNITPGGVSSFNIRAWHNESSYVDIKRHNDINTIMRPKITLTVNGAVRTYYAVDSATVRAGNYKNSNYNSTDTIKAKTFGNFLGDETYNAVLKFDFSGLSSADKITAAKLSVYAKASPEFSGSKRLVILKEPTNAWSGATINWNTLPGFVYSYNGLPGKNDWVNKPVGSDFEYWYQMARFNGYNNAILPEYLATGDETYIYKMLSILNDYLKDAGNYKMSSTAAYNSNGIRGGFTRSLDASFKNTVFISMLEILAKYQRTTPELFTAIMKNIWDTANFLTVYNTASGNWRQYEFESILNAADKVPEFYDALAGKNWKQLAQNELEAMLFLNTLADGSYNEATAGYNTDAFKLFVDYKAKTEAAGNSVSIEYDELLHKTAYYNALLYTPNGQNILYGDSGLHTRGTSDFQKVYNWYSDKELEYIISYGQTGKIPDWTSKHWPLSTLTAMRADWSVNSPYLFTNVRGGGGHAHADYNGIIAYAYGRTLLNDAGIFSYDDSDPYRAWGKSTAAHNSVVINDTSQTIDYSLKGSNGKIYDWVTTDSYDYLSQSTPSNPGFEHRRSISFIKQPAMWIVSDLMIPKSTNSQNNYKQTWHMPPDAGLTASQSKGTINSSYSSGANIIVANADGTNAELKTEAGFYSTIYGAFQNAPYAYFEKNGVGNQTFDTVLIPSNNDPTAAASTEKLPTTANSTALKIDFKLNGSDYTGYYYMSYNNQLGFFGKYSTDAKMAFVLEKANGGVEKFIIENGSYIKNEETGRYLTSDERPPMFIDPSEDNITDENGYLFYEDFESGNPSCLIDGSAAVKPVITSGKAQFTTTGNWGKDYFRIWFKQDKSDIQPNTRHNTAFEFDLETEGDAVNVWREVVTSVFNGARTDPEAIRLRTAPHASEQHFEAWNGSNVVNLNPVTLGQTTSNTGTNPNLLPKKMTITVVVNFKNNTYDLYLNGKLYATKFAFRPNSPGGIGLLDFYPTGAYTTYVDNIKVYRVKSDFVIHELDEAASGWTGSSYKAVFPTYSLDEQEHEVYMVIAAYNNEKLTVCNIIPVTVTPKTNNVSEDIIYGILSVPEKTENTRIKAMVWENMNSLRPLVRAE